MEGMNENTLWMKGKCFVLTGGFGEEGAENISKLIADGGGYTQHKVTPGVDYVIWYPEGFGETKKLKQAQEFNGQGAGIGIYSMEEFVCLLNGDRIESSVVQCHDTIHHIADYLAQKDPDMIEMHLEKYGIDLQENQRTLLELLKCYNRTSILRQKKWFDTVAQREGMLYELYKAAALYFARIHDLEMASDLCLKMEKEASLCGKSEDVLAGDLSFLHGKIDQYRKKPYWPKNLQQRLELSKVYDEKGIPHPLPEENSSGQMYAAGSWMTPLTNSKVEELSSEINSLDYSSDEDGKYTAFVDINAFDINGLGSRTIQTLLDLGMVKSFGDIFRLERYRSTLVTGKVLTEKTAAKMMDSIEKARQISDLKFLTALHIPGIREDAARRILKQWSIHELLKMGEHPENLYQLTAAEGIGPQISACFFLWFENDANVEMLKDLLKEVTIREQSKEETGNRCAGLTFVTTGKLYFYKNRDALKQYIFSEGGNFSEKLGANVSYLINNDLNSPSSKNKKAKSLGIPIISEQQFLDEFSDGAVK